MPTVPAPGAGVPAALLLLADGRFPTGGHVHSAGMEAALADGRVRTVADVEAFVVGRLWTTALADAAVAVAVLRGLAGAEHPRAVLDRLDAEADARIPVEALRAASRRQGRQLARVAGGCWALPTGLADVHPDGPHAAVALGAVAHAAGLGADDTAVLSLHHAVGTPLQAALRLGGFDPFALAALAARLDPTIALVAGEAVRADPGDLPCAAPPLAELTAIAHARDPERLFAT